MSRSESSSISISRRGSVTGDPDRTVVWVRGEHDLATRVSLTAAIDLAAQLDEADLLVDLSGVTFMDASTLGAIVGSARRLRWRSLSLRVRAPSPCAFRVLDLCGYAQLVDEAPAATALPSETAAARCAGVDAPSADRCDHAAVRREAHTATEPAGPMGAAIYAELDLRGR